MHITEIRTILAAEQERPLCAYTTVAFDDCLAIHDLRVLRRGDRYFVAMPNRKRMAPCGQCRAKNPVQANFCNRCGARLRIEVAHESQGISRIYVDIAHPLTPEFRQELERQVIDHYQHTVAGREELRSEIH